MTNAAIQDVNDNIVRTGFATIEGIWNELFLRAVGGVGLGGEHGEWRLVVSVV